MKVLFFALLLLGVAARAQACTSFVGAYQSSEGAILRVAQLKCESLTIASQESAQSKPVVDEFLIDGQRHEIQNMFWLTYWVGTTLVREPWSAATDGMELGFRELWTLDGEALTDVKRDASDNSEIVRTVYQRVPSR